MFACQIRVVLTHEYPTIWVNTNLTCLLNGSRFLNPNTTHLLNELVVSTCLSKRKKNSINQIDMNYEIQKIYI